MKLGHVVDRIYFPFAAFIEVVTMVVSSLNSFNKAVAFFEIKRFPLIIILTRQDKNRFHKPF